MRTANRADGAARARAQRAHPSCAGRGRVPRAHSRHPARGYGRTAVSQLEMAVDPAPEINSTRRWTMDDVARWGPWSAIRRRDRKPLCSELLKPWARGKAAGRGRHSVKLARGSCRTRLAPRPPPGFRRHTLFPPIVRKFGNARPVPSAPHERFPDRTNAGPSQRFRACDAWDRMFVARWPWVSALREWAPLRGSGAFGSIDLAVEHARANGAETFAIFEARPRRAMRLVLAGS